MLFLVTGKTGSGKSYFCVEKILEFVAAGRKVVTNIPIYNLSAKNLIYKNEDSIKEFFATIEKDFSTIKNMQELVSKYKNHEEYGDAVFFIDEAHLLGFRKNSESISNWLSIHRHFGQDIFVITQTLAKINRAFLPDFQTWYELVPANRRINKGLMGYKEYDDILTKNLVAKKTFKPKKEIFDYYKTGKAEASTNKLFYKFAGIILGIAVLFLLSVYQIYKGYDVVAGYSSERNETLKDGFLPDTILGASADKNVSEHGEAVERKTVTCYYSKQIPADYVALIKKGEFNYVCVLK